MAESRLRRFLALPAKKRWLLARAGLLLATVRVSLWGLPFHLVRRRIEAWSSRSEPPPDPPSVADIRWAIAVTSRRIPGATCLPRALAARALLVRAGHPARLRLGVAKDEGSLRAHAWVELGEEVVEGRVPDLARYQPLPEPAASESTAADFTSRRGT